jgi:hypothetical protein
MKKIFTIICLFCIFNLQSQTGTIKVTVQDICERLFDKPLTVDLYKINDLDTVYKSTSSGNPLFFSDITTPGKYMVKLKSSEMSNTVVDLKDILYLRKYILGIPNQATKATTIISDITNDGVASTLDLVFLQRHIIGINTFDLNEWKFFSKYIYYEDGNNPYDSKINTIIFTTDAVDTTSIISFAMKHGDVSATIPSSCNICKVDSFRGESILIPAIEVKKDSIYNFDISVNKGEQSLGFTFSLNYDKMLVQQITPTVGTSFNDVTNMNSINFINLYNDPSVTGLYAVANIKIKALEDGNLQSFFTLNPLFENDFIYQDTDCIKSIPLLYVNFTPVNCSIQWPQDITIQDCNLLDNVGIPIVNQECNEFFFSFYKDEIVGTPCSKIIRNWQIINLISLEITSHTQIINIDKNYKTICLNSQIIIEGNTTIFAKDLINQPIMGHNYSFNQTNYEPSKMLTYTMPYVENLTIYDTTSQEFCIAKVTKVECNNTANFLDQISSIHNGEATYTVTGAMFDAGNVSICPGNFTDFQISEIDPINYASFLKFPVQQYKGTTLDLKLRCKINGNFVELGLVKVNFVDQNIPVFNFSCYDDALVEGVPYEIVFFSPDFKNLLGMQGGIAVKDATILSSEKYKLSDIAFNQQINSLIFVWISAMGLPANYSISDSLFSMSILPSKSGNVSDFISLDENLAASEAIPSDLLLSKIGLVFNFIKRQSATSDENIDNSVSIYPNPNNGSMLYVRSSLEGKINVKVKNLNGQLYLSEKIESEAINQIALPSNMPAGIYFVEIATGDRHLTKKLIIAR